VWDKALAYCRQAGEKAMARSAYSEAVGSFEQALTTLSHLPDARATREQALDLRLAMRSALWPSGDRGRILLYLREAEALAESLDDARRLGQVLLFLANHFNIIHAYDQAIAAAQRALALATASGDDALHALANQRLGQAYRAHGDYRRAIDCLGQAAAFFGGTRGPERFGRVSPPAVNCRSNLARCHTELGTFPEGRVLGEEGLRIAEALADPVSLMFALHGIGMLFLRQGDLPRAFPRLERAMSICQEADTPLFFPDLAASLGAAYTLAGHVTDALPLLEQAEQRGTAMGTTGGQSLRVGYVSEAYLLAGRMQEAMQLAGRALDLARAHKERGHEAWALRLLGEIAAHQDPLEIEPAEHHYRQALALAEALGMRPLQAHCHLGLGKLYAKTGQREQARAELSTAIDLYRAMQMTFWLPQAEAALAQVEGH
jgi:tetratricopeptide (TPR) repeat protein